MASSDKIADKWLSWLRRIQASMLVWLIFSQIAFLWIEKIAYTDRRAIITLSCLVIAGLSVAASAHARNRWVLLVVFASEMVALFGAALFALISGVELAWLVTLARFGLRCPLSAQVAVSLLSCAAFFYVSWFNHDLVVQSSFGFVQSRGLLGAIFGREFLNYLIGLLFVNVLIQAIMTEQKNRHFVEKLSGQLELMAKELERNRIAREINENVDHLLVELSARAAVLSESSAEPDKFERELMSAKELASLSLRNVRESLNLLRRVNPDD